MQAEVKREILLMVHRAKEKGVKLTRSCEILQLPLQRYCAWSRRDREEKLDGVSDPLLDGKPGPAPDEAPHGLLREEKEQISALLRDETYADLPPHQLAVVASEKGVVQASASSFYRQARKERLARRKQVRTPVKQSKPQVKPEGPNQVWSWDLTYIPFFGLFLYFTAILDVYSRKIVGWKLSFNATVEQVKQAWDQALANEGLLDLDTGPISLTALSDHGSQMKAKSMAQFFKDLGISQLFARYQTPTDNAWIEAFFRTFKYDWLRFQDIFTFHQLEGLIASFIHSYNAERYHGAIQYVTPLQRHTGQHQKILHHRQGRKEEARQRRIEINRQRTSQTIHKAA